MPAKTTSSYTAILVALTKERNRRLLLRIRLRARLQLKRKDLKQVP